MNHFLEIILGQLPEAIYFAIFMLFVKDLKEHRIKFIILSSIEYIMFMLIFPYSIYSHIGYFITTYCLLKVLYKERAQITDVFSLGIGSIILIGISALSYGIGYLCNKNYVLTIVLSRVLLFLFLITSREKLHKIQLMYKFLWNRHDERKTPIKSTTFRALNTCVFNIMFYTINLGMLFILFQNRG